MEELQLKIKTLTPIWTGGVEPGKMDRIHETGLLGALRWWYEAIVRALGGKACDPSQREKCTFDAKKYRESRASDESQRLRDAGLCDVCQVFGATGWRRRFRVALVDQTEAIWDGPDQTLNIRPPERTRGWYLGSGRMGEFTLNLQAEEKTIALLASLVLFLERWGTLGARPQLGYGAFLVINRDEVRERAQDWKWEVLDGISLSPPSENLPDLRRFLFFRFDFQPAQAGWWTRVPGVSRVASQVQLLLDRFNTVPITPALKNEWRFNRWQRVWGNDRDIFGSLYPERKRGRIAATWAYRMNAYTWRVHGWTWMPVSNQAANGLWSILTDSSVWQQVFSVQGKLVWAPTGNAWQVWQAEQVRDFLEEVWP